MDPVFIPILAICCGLFAVIGSKIVKPILQHRERRLEIESQMVVEKAAQYAAKTERLEQRVAVLERILTDRSSNLADEIERLRDQPLN
jgi:ABC-type phosphate transport system auxiliary subunit